MDGFEVITFIVSVVGVSLSGVLMPGPVTAVTMARGSESPHAGAWVSIGHGVIELPLMALIYFGAGALFKLAPVKIGIGLAGGLILLWMGSSMLRDYNKVDSAAAETKMAGYTRSPFLAGILLSAGNPYFLVWWATVGAALVSQSLQFGLIGFGILVAAHWSCDLIWYYFLSALSFGGGRFFGARLQQGVFIVCGLALIYFSGYFMVKAVFTAMGIA